MTESPIMATFSSRVVLRADVTWKSHALPKIVTTGGPAAKAGLKDGDLVTAVDGKAVASYEEFTAAFQGKNAGDKVKLTVKRDGKEQEIEVTLGTRPGEEGAAGGGGRKGGGKGGERKGSGVATGGTSGGPVLGVSFGDSLTVATVLADGPAAKAGLKKGDLVYARYWQRGWQGKGKLPPSTSGHRGLPSAGATVRSLA